MRIATITDPPLTELPFLNAGRGPGSFYVDQLPVHVAESPAVPEDLEAIVVTADLQGRERFEDAVAGPPRLLGEVLPRRLCEELLPDMGVAPDRTGVLLAGDFYTVPGLDQRGGSGDVSKVWQAFAEEFRWVAGVAGNHDTYGDQLAPPSRLAGNAHYLDGETVTLDRLRIAGIGGIIGNPRKAHRKTEDEFLRLVDQLGGESPDILVMHDGPDFPSQHFRGSPRIREAVEQTDVPLLVRGHAHWGAPLVQLDNGTQVLNVDCRLVVIKGQR